jgi:hypothetical protein
MWQSLLLIIDALLLGALTVAFVMGALWFTDKLAPAWVPEDGEFIPKGMDATPYTDSIIKSMQDERRFDPTDAL